MLHRLKYAFMREGVNHPYGWLHGGQTINCERHAVFFDDAFGRILVFWDRDKDKHFYLASEHIGGYALKDPEFKVSLDKKGQVKEGVRVGRPPAKEVIKV